MANNNGVISKPVRQIADVKYVLGANVKGLGQLINSGLVNMWAKYKPVRIPYKTTELTEADRASVNYGLSWTEYSSASDLMTAAHSLGQGGLAWAYLLPRGYNANYSEWYRRLDFNGYDHGASCPFVAYPSADAMYAVDPSPTLILNMPVSGQGQISISDLQLGSPYLAYRNGNNGTVYTTAATTGMNLPHSGSGTYQFALYFKPSTMYIPAPYPYFEMETNSNFGIDFNTKNVTYTLRNTTLKMSITLLNLGRSRTLNAVSIHRRRDKVVPSDPDHWSVNSDGFTYTITSEASHVATDYEIDVNVGVSATYDPNTNRVNLGNTSQELIYSLQVDPYQNQGRFFIRVQYTYTNPSGTTNTKDMYLPLSVTLPENPTL